MDKQVVLQTASLDQQVSIQKTRMLYWDNVQSILWTVLVSLSYTGIMLVLLPHSSAPLMWLAVLSVVTVLRFALSVYVLKRRKLTADTHTTLRYVFLLLLCASSLVWGFGALFFVPQLSVSGALLTLMSLVCLCMGAMPYLYHDRFAVALFFTGAILPLVAWLAMQSQWLYAIAGVSAVLVVMASYLISRKLYSFMTRTMVLQIENAKLFNNLVEANKELQKKSATDILTKVPNRRAFTEEFKKIHSNLYRTGQFLSIVILDIDYFKRVNDTYGHVVGDKVLARVARVIQSKLKRPSDFVARYGGEEFVVMLPSTEADGAVQVAQDIVDAVSQTPMSDLVSDTVLTVTISAGVASVLATESASIDFYISKADKALYEAKNAGRNRVRLFQELAVEPEALKRAVSECT